MKRKEITRILLNLENDLYKMERLNSIIDITTTAMLSDDISCSDPSVADVLVEVYEEQQEVIEKIKSVIIGLRKDIRK